MLTLVPPFSCSCLTQIYCSLSFYMFTVFLQSLSLQFSQGTGLGDEWCRLGKNPVTALKLEGGGRLNVTFKSSQQIDSGPSGSSGKYLSLTGDTKINK